MSRGSEVYSKLKKALNIEGEKKERLEKQKRLNEDRKRISNRVKLAKSGKASANPVNVPEIFKGKGDEIEEEQPKKRRQTRKATKKTVELEGEEV